MIESLKASLAVWYGKTNERAKLQHTYIVAAIILLIAAGLIGLVNHTIGQNILVVAIISATMFLINAVTWSLLQSAVLSRLGSRRSPTPRKK